MNSIKSISLFALIVGLSFLCIACSDEVNEFDCPEEGQDYYSADTEIGKLYEFCFGSNEECRDYELGLQLYLDTVNLPKPDDEPPFINLQSLPGPGGQRDHVSFVFNDSLPSGYYELMNSQLGWKVAISDARIEFCDVCYTNCGLAKIIRLYGDPETVEFFFDPEDTLEVFIDHSLIE